LSENRHLDILGSSSLKGGFSHVLDFIQGNESLPSLLRRSRGG